MQHQLPSEHPGSLSPSPPPPPPPAPTNPHPKRRLINAILRGQVVLGCNLQPPDLEDAVSLVLWYKDNSMVPIYSVDARASPVQLARHKPGAWLEGRSALKIVASQADDSDHEQSAASGPSGQRARRHIRSALIRNVASDYGNPSGDQAVDDDYGHEEEADDASRGPESAQRNFSSPSMDLLLVQRHHSAFASPSGRRRRHSKPMHPFRPLNGPWSAEAGQQRWTSARSSFGVRNRRAQLQLQPPRDDASDSAGKHLVARLLIDSLSSEDNGIYRCRVDFRRARSRIEETELRIVVPAEKPMIRDLTHEQSQAAGRQELHVDIPQSQHNPNNNNHNYQHQTAASGLIVGPHNEGDRVVLECETSGGYPEPSLSWWRDGQLVDDSYEIVAASSGQLLERRRASPLADSDPGSDSSLPAAHLGQGFSSEAGQGPLEADNENDNPLGPPSGAQADPAQPRTKQLAAGSSGPLSQSRLIRNRLELGPIGRADLLANYSCVAWNSKLGEPPTSFAMIDMNLRPLKVQIDNERLPVLADKQLEIVCRIYGSRPAPQVSWWRGQQRLESRPDAASDQGGRAQVRETTSLDPNVTTSTLWLWPRLEDAGQAISCRAESAPARARLAPQPQPPPGATLEDSWRLEVHHLPRVRLQLGDKLLGRKLHEGQDVYLECSVRAQPAAHELRWWFAGKELETNISSGIIISNQSLVLQRVSRNQRGSYTCSAINQVGESHSNGLQLNIQHAPYCRHTVAVAAHQQQQQHQQPKLTYGAAKLEQVRVRCQVEADPADALTYKWAFVANGPTNSSAASAGPNHGQPQPWAGQQLTYLDSSHLLEPSDGSVATWTPKSELDYGTLLCWAQNALGAQLDPCAYRVVAAELPEPVRNCRLMDATEAQLTVACEPGYDGGSEQRFHMEVYEARGGRELVANVSASSLLGPRLGGLNGQQQQQQQQLQSANEAGAGREDAPERPANDQAPAEQQQQPASLISGESNQAAASTSEPAASAKRHSTQSNGQQAMQSLAERRRPPLDYSEQQLKQSAIFITGPKLVPATDYLLTIYATNSRGSSKPIAFTASTKLQAPAHADGADHGLATSSGRASASSRDGRRLTDAHSASSAGNGQPFSLSWSPFVVVCTVTVLIFVLFASVTYAMLKYADLAGALWSPSQQLNGPSSRKHHQPRRGPSAGPADSQCPRAHLGDGLAGQITADQLQQLSLVDTDEQRRESIRRARVVAIGGACKPNNGHPCGGPNASEQADSVRLSLQDESQTSDGVACGSGSIRSSQSAAPTAFQRSQGAPNSLLANGCYLSFRMQQRVPPNGSQQRPGLDGCGPQASGRLKQSNSDNYLNEHFGHHHHQHQQHQQLWPDHASRYSATLYQVDQAAGGYIVGPRRLVSGTLPRHLGVCSSAAEAGQQQQQLTMQLQPLAGESTSLAMLQAPKLGASSAACDLRAGDSTPPIEHLVIGGQQYVQAAAPRPGPGPGKQQPWHLQVTSDHETASEPRPQPQRLGAAFASGQQHLANGQTEQLLEAEAQQPQAFVDSSEGNLSSQAASLTTAATASNGSPSSGIGAEPAPACTDGAHHNYHNHHLQHNHNHGHDRQHLARLQALLAQKNRTLQAQRQLRNHHQLGLQSSSSSATLGSEHSGAQGDELTPPPPPLDGPQLVGEPQVAGLCVGECALGGNLIGITQLSSCGSIDKNNNNNSLEQFYILPTSSASSGHTNEPANCCRHLQTDV